MRLSLVTHAVITWNTVLEPVHATQVRVPRRGWDRVITASAEHHLRQSTHAYSALRASGPRQSLRSGECYPTVTANLAL